MSGIAGAIVLLLATPATAQAGLCDWVGGASNNWESTANWGGDCAFGNLPGLTDDIRIPAAAARFPTLSTAQSFRGMQIEAGAVMTITASGEATLSGDSAVTGTIRSLPGSRLTLAPGVSGSLARFANSQVIQGELRLGGAGLSSGTLAMDGSSRLTISSTGSLVLGAGFAGGSDWNFQGQLDNRGLISMAKDLTINAPGAVHTSTGEIRIAAGASLAFVGGATQRVTLGGSVVLTASASPGAPAELIVNGGTFIHLGGTLTGTGAMALRNGVTGTLTGDMVNRLGELSVRNSTLTGSANLDNRGLLTLDQSVIGTELSNAGLITSRLTNTLSGKVTILPGSTLQLLPSSANEPVWLQVDKGLENNGTLDLSSAAGTSNWRWYVTSPVLTNTPTGQINVALSSAKAIFSGQILNQGTLNVLGSLTISRTGKTHSNSGVMLLQGQTDFAQALTSTGTISQSGDLFSVAGDFVNLGTYSIGAPMFIAGPSAADGFRIIARAGLVANRPGGIINVNAQADLEAELLNQGMLNVLRSLTISRTGKIHANSGVMLLQGQTDFAQALTSTGTISQSGDLFSVAGDFVNLGTYSIGAPVLVAGPSADEGFRSVARSGLVANRPGGTININQQADLEAELQNQGILNVLASLAISRTGKTHSNSGVMLLQGQTTFAQALTSTGTISQSGDLFSVAGDFVNLGTYNIGAPVVLAGPSAADGFRSMARGGLVANRPGGTININQQADLEAELLNQGTLNVQGSLTISRTGKTHSNSGVMLLQGQTDFAQALTSAGTISQTGDLFSVAGDFVNLGTYSIGAPVFIAGPSAADGFRIIGRSGLVANRPGGTINVNSQADLEAELLNQGTLNVQGLLTISRTGKTHTNSGVMLLQGQTIFAQALTSTGSISQTGDLFSVAGDFVNLGTYSIGAPVVVARPSAAEGFRVVARAGLVANRPGGIINVGEGTFFAAPSAAEGFRSVARSGRTVNGGTVNVGGGTLMDAPSLASVTLETQFINQGTLNIHTTLEVSATGRVHQNSGLVRVYADASFGQALTSTGTISIPAASLSIATDYTQTSGLTALNGTLSVPEARILGGALRGSGTLKGNLTNGALVAPGNSPGALTVSGDYTQLPAGSLNIELGGTTAGSQYDTLTVSGSASLSGTLNVSLVNAFTPVNGNAFTFLSAASRSGAFATVTGVNMGGGKRLAPVYGPDFARLLMQGRVTFLPQLLK